MANVKDLMGPRLLRGVNLPKAGIIVYAFAAVAPPAGINSKLLLRIDPIPVKNEEGVNQIADHVPLNFGNIQEIAKAMGSETDDWQHMEVTLVPTKTTNPQTKAAAIGMRVAKVQKAKKQKEEDPY